MGILELGIDLRGCARELKARGRAVAVSHAVQRDASSWITDRQRQGLGFAAGIGIGDREEAQAFAKTGRDRAGRTAGGVGENRITHRQERNSGGGGGTSAIGAIVQLQAQAHGTGIGGLQRDRRIGQQAIDLGQGARHQPVRGAVNRERGAATVRANAEAAEVGIVRSQEQPGGAAVLGQIGIGHADRLVADQALQAGDNAMAQARHGAEGWHTAEYGWIIHRRHRDRGAAEALAGAARSQTKAQRMVAIGIASGREGQQSTGLQIGIEITDRAHEGQLGAVAPRHRDAHAVAGAETAAGCGVF